jgi:hypothetical protein
MQAGKPRNGAEVKGLATEPMSSGQFRGRLRPILAQDPVTSMASFLKSLASRLFGGATSEIQDEPESAVEYKGYRIRPAPYAARGQFQTAGLIEKETPDGVKEHRFVRAETLPSKADASEFAIRKAKQIIDEQGDRLFG